MWNSWCRKINWDILSTDEYISKKKKQCSTFNRKKCVNFVRFANKNSVQPQTAGRSVLLGASLRTPRTAAFLPRCGDVWVKTFIRNVKGQSLALETKQTWSLKMLKAQNSWNSNQKNLFGPHVCCALQTLTHKIISLGVRSCSSCDKVRTFFGCPRIMGWSDSKFFTCWAFWWKKPTPTDGTSGETILLTCVFSALPTLLNHTAWNFSDLCDFGNRRKT